MPPQCKDRDPMNKPKLLILGTRGIPGNYGGFETFAERLALYLNARGWEVTVYCQCVEEKPPHETWQGINLINISVPKNSAFWSIIFDLKATWDSLKRPGIKLVLGYNTAIFSLFYYIKRSTLVTNMDGMEWHRRRWNIFQKTWLFLNERCAMWFSNQLIADHPQIKMYLLNQGVPGSHISCIPYSSEAVHTANIGHIHEFGLLQEQYALVIARSEPENSILEIVTAFSRYPRGYKLVILGKYLPSENPYHKEVLDVASEEVVFLGAIYDKAIVQALRYYARLYIHGHTVGGTNPSLIEAMSVGTPILAHFNRFNYWVAGSDSQYFYDQEDCDLKLEQLLDNPRELQSMRQASLSRYEKFFSEDKDLEAYRQLFLTLPNAQDDAPASELESQGSNQALKEAMPEKLSSH